MFDKSHMPIARIRLASSFWTIESDRSEIYWSARRDVANIQLMLYQGQLCPSLAARAHSSQQLGNAFKTLLAEIVVEKIAKRVIELKTGMVERENQPRALGAGALKE